MTNATVGLAVGLSVACWLATNLRWVPRGQCLVAVRAGVVSRVYDSGPAWRLPWVERFETVRTAPHDMPLMVRAATEEGTRVVLLAEVVVSLPRPEPGGQCPDPWPVAERLAEETVARVVSTWSAVDLASAATAHRRVLRHAVSAAVDSLGVTVLDLEVVEVGVPVDERVSDSGRR